MTENSLKDNTRRTGFRYRDSPRLRNSENIEHAGTGYISETDTQLDYLNIGILRKGLRVKSMGTGILSTALKNRQYPFRSTVCNFNSHYPHVFTLHLK
ncbi:hypothetical protein NPIL_548671 [Nephila pilipes]|uniref:Uncharacterized protein n=1 Tax=Nephila pilipes TaxID=299642 RepID=A0A8X6QX87_NEPPI|nr:hypothetical protein NPIL_548671 [Nephila pilipes]